MPFFPGASIPTLAALGWGILVAVMSVSPGCAQSSSGQAPVWQIGSSALAGKQTNPVMFLAPEQVGIAASRPATIDLHFRIAEGLHINSHHPHDSTLVPTQVLVADTTGVDTGAIDFPNGTDTTLAFAPDQKLSVYTGELTLHAHVIVRPGSHLWQGVMRYQACDNRECLPPKKVPFTVVIEGK